MNQKESQTNILSILGFIFSFLLTIPGLILSILGLKESKKTNSGKGLSIAGIIISSIRLLIILIVIFLFISIPASKNATNNMKEEIYCQQAYNCIIKSDTSSSCLYKDKSGREKEIICHHKNNNTIKNDNDDNQEIDDEINDNDINNNIDNSEKIKKFLTNSYISTSGAVGSADPEGYYFDNNGNFAYHHGGYCISEENQKISYRGTWELENNELTLNVVEEEIAVGGTIEEDVVSGNCLTNYKNIINKTNKKIIYKINKYVEEELYLELDNGENLYIIGADYEKLKNIANNGY